MAAGRKPRRRLGRLGACNLAAFGMQLRERYDLDSVLDELLGLTDEVLQPEHASLWIREVRRQGS